MPVFSASTTVRASSNRFSLSLNVRHFLAVGILSDIATTARGSLTDDVDVVLESNLVLSLSGKFNNVKMSSESIVESAVAHHLRAYLELNASQLGLNTISEVYIDDDGLSKMTLCASRPIRKGPHSPYVKLVALDMNFIWKTIPSECVEPEPHYDAQPFASKLLLPYRSILDRVIERFVTYQLVRRYPLIFGPLGQKLDSEYAFFPPIARSLLDIIKSSTSPSFQRKCGSVVKMVKQKNVSASLSKYLSTASRVDTLEDLSVKQFVTDEETLCISMERLFKRGLRRTLFKCITLGSNPTLGDIEDESYLVVSQASDTPHHPHSRLPDYWDASPSVIHDSSSFVLDNNNHDNDAELLECDHWESPVPAAGNNYLQRSSSNADPDSETDASSFASQDNSSSQSQSLSRVFQGHPYDDLFGFDLQANYITSSGRDSIWPHHFHLSTDSLISSTLDQSTLSNIAPADRQKVNSIGVPAPQDLPFISFHFCHPQLPVFSSEGQYPANVDLDSDSDCDVLSGYPPILHHGFANQNDMYIPQNISAFAKSDGSLSEPDILDCDALSDMDGDVPDAITAQQHPGGQFFTFQDRGQDQGNDATNHNRSFFAPIADPDVNPQLQNLIMERGFEDDIEDGILNFDDTGL